MSESRRGTFVVIEGLDRSGKSTQASLLYDRLVSEGRKVRLLKFPDRTTAIGKMIDSYLRSESELDDHAVHLLFSANRWEAASSIEASLRAGITVVCDRYAFSEGCEKLTYEWCRAPDVGLPAPDVTIFLDVSPEIAKARGGYGDERYEKEEHQQRVRDVFARIRDDVRLSDLHWATIDAGRNKCLIHKEIVDLVKNVTHNHDMHAPKVLWPQID